jgi:hypothetical protein
MYRHLMIDCSSVNISSALSGIICLSSACLSLKRAQLYVPIGYVARYFRQHVWGLLPFLVLVGFFLCAKLSVCVNR